MVCYKENTHQLEFLDTFQFEDTLDILEKYCTFFIRKISFHVISAYIRYFHS